jgi:protein-S-isoprenylcysteine O-methyltransferase Ste14
VILFAFYLVFSEAPRLGTLDAYLILPSLAKDAAGLAVTAAGIAFAAWARFSLGKNWSGTVTMKQNHELVRKGPYEIVRHPIYSGFLFAALGTALIHGRVRNFVGVGVAFFGFWLKSRLEEKYMLELFDGEYVKYKKEVKGFIPRII